LVVLAKIGRRYRFVLDESTLKRLLMPQCDSLMGAK